MVETIRTERFSMQYFRFGEGEKVFVILPGLSITSVMLLEEQVRDAYDIFSGEYTVYLFDRRLDLPSRYTVRDMARDTAEAIRFLGLKDIYLFGASQGGMIAQVIAIENPDLVRKMVLGSTAPRVIPETGKVLEEWMRLAREKDLEGLYMSFGKFVYPPRLFEEYKPALLEAAKSVTDEDLARFLILAGAAEGFDVLDEIEKIRCEVLVIGDYEDPVLDSDAIMQIAEKLDLNPVSIYMYTGYGHGAFDTAPDYKERIAEFFSRQG